LSITLKYIGEVVAILEVDRPQVRNALDWDAIHKFGELVDTAHKNSAIRALIVTGAGDNFIAGGDLKVLHNYPTKADGERLSLVMSETLNHLEALPYPTIAAMNGPARGGGAEIALACDLRIMSEDADFGLVQVKLGLTPGWGAGQRLLRLVGYSRAFDLLATGRVLSSQQALECGLANRLAASGKALEAAIELARQTAAQSKDTIEAVKRILRAGVSLDPENAAARERAEFPTLWAADDHISAVQRFLDRKK
jgi:enoyl-CoA hydratase